MERRVALLDVGGLPVDLPVVEVSSRCVAAEVAGPGVSARAANLVVQPRTGGVDVVRRAGGCARGEHDVGIPEIQIEIFQPERPVRRERDFRSGTGRPAGVQMQDPVGLVDDAGRLNEASQRPREPARGVDHPVLESVPDAPAQRSHQLNLFGNVGVGGGAKPSQFVRRQSVQDGQVGLDAQKQA